jgi:hypothetical protein
MHQDISLAPPDFFELIRGLIKVCLCLICSVNKTLQRLYLERNQIGDAGATSIGGALAYVQTSIPKCSVFEFIHFVCNLVTPPDFFGLIMALSRRFCMICSQNNTLTELRLDSNQIGDAGADSIGCALAYVNFSPCE